MRLIDANELKVSISEKIKVDSHEKDDVVNGILQVIDELPTVNPFSDSIAELQNMKTNMSGYLDGIDYAISIIAKTYDRGDK